VEVIRELARQNPDIIVGAGTLFYADSARSCLDAGARFLTTTGFDLDIVNLALGRHTVVFPGVLTATEVMVASKAGCDFVKIFPCAQVGGPSYIRALIHQDAIKKRNSSWIRELARRYTNMVSEARSLANPRLGEVP
jgi:2-dehydro-3-deoxyphosphogluconate aldolase / (4S)-4-hydroxy-2-oxoglutarate aldolase